MARSYNASRRDVDFNKDSLVWLDIYYFKILRLFKKLNILTNRLFRVLEKVGHLYCLELLASIKVYNVFPASKLRKDFNNPLLGQV